MARDYKKEYKNQKQNYSLVKAYLKKSIGIALKIKLKNENKSIAQWILENATKYINE